MSTGDGPPTLSIRKREPAAAVAVTTHGRITRDEIPARTRPITPPTKSDCSRLSPPAGQSDGTAPPGGEPFAITGGESSVFDQYLEAIDHARRSIYLEDQAIGAPRVVGHLKAALDRSAVSKVLSALKDMEMGVAFEGKGKHRALHVRSRWFYRARR